MKLITLFLFLLMAGEAYAQEIPKSFAVVIIGGGPAGLSCATACAKVGYPTLVCDEEKSGVIYPDIAVTNWPGLPQMTWQKAAGELRKDFTKHGGMFAYTHVKAITKNQGIFHINTDMGIFHAPAVVIATGKLPPPKRIPITIENPTRVLSRLYDASALYPSDTVIIIGNTENTLSTACLVAARVKRVYLFLQPPWKSTGSIVERIARKLPTVTWMKSDRITSITGLKGKAIVEFQRMGSKIVQEASWVIFAEEWVPQSALLRGLGQRDSSGAIVTFGTSGNTATIGLFACGEVASHGFLHGISSAADGLNTSTSVCQFLLDRSPLPIPPPLLKEETPPLPPQPSAGETGPSEPEF